MRVLIDSDVLLDLLLARKPFVDAARPVLIWAEKNPGLAGVAWHSFSNMAYIARASPRVREFLADLADCVTIPPTGDMEIRRALALPMSDLEDAMIAAAAVSFGASFIVTRNVRDYAHAPIRAIKPEQFEHELSREDG